MHLLHKISYLVKFQVSRQKVYHFSRAELSNFSVMQARVIKYQTMKGAIIHMSLNIDQYCLTIELGKFVIYFYYENLNSTRNCDFFL